MVKSVNFREKSFAIFAPLRSVKSDDFATRPEVAFRKISHYQ